MTRGQRLRGTCECRDSVVGSVVRDHAHAAGDAVGGEIGASTSGKLDRRLRGLVLERFGVGQAGKAIDRGVQVGVADLLSVRPFAGQRSSAAAAVGRPTTALRDPPDLLHIQVDHVAREPRRDPTGLTVVLPGRVEVATAEDPEAFQPPRDRPDAAAVPLLGKLEGDAASGPLVISTPPIDQFNCFEGKTAGTSDRWRKACR